MTNTRDLIYCIKLLHTIRQEKVLAQTFPLSPPLAENPCEILYFFKDLGVGGRPTILGVTFGSEFSGVGPETLEKQGQKIHRENLMNNLQRNVPKILVGPKWKFNPSPLCRHSCTRVRGTPCRAARVAADFLRILGFFRCGSGIALHPPYKALSHLSPLNGQECRTSSCL